MERVKAQLRTLFKHKRGSFFAHSVPASCISEALNARVDVVLAAASSLPYLSVDSMSVVHLRPIKYAERKLLNALNLQPLKSDEHEAELTEALREAIVSAWIKERDSELNDLPLACASVLKALWEVSGSQAFPSPPCRTDTIG